MIFRTIVVLTLSSFLNAQVPILELEYDIGVDTRISNILFDDTNESILFGVSNWVIAEPANFSLISYSLADGTEEEFDLSESLPATAHGISIAEISGAKFLLGIDQEGDDRLFLAELDDQFRIGELTYFPVAVMNADVLIYDLNLVESNDKFLLVGSYSSGNSPQIKTYAVEINPDDSFAVLRNTVLSRYLAAVDAVYINNTWILDHADTYTLDLGEIEWQEVDYLSLNKMFRSVNIYELPDGNMVVAGRQHGSILFRNGLIVKTIDANFQTIRADSLFFTSNLDIVTYGSIRAISVNTGSQKIYVGGTTEVTDDYAGFRSLKPSKLFIAGYDYGLSKEFLFTYQAPVFYRNFDTKHVGSNTIVSSGIKYSPTRERLQAYILLFAEDELVSSREQALPERATLVAPNPSAGAFRFIWDEQQSQPVPFKIYSGLGQLVRTGEIAYGQIIDLEGAPSGVYYLLAEVGDKVLTQRLMVQL